MKLSKIYNLILPNKVINIFVYSLIIFGVISGSLFLMLSNETDKNSVIEQITNFFVKFNKNRIFSKKKVDFFLTKNFIDDILFIVSVC